MPRINAGKISDPEKCLLGLLHQLHPPLTDDDVRNIGEMAREEMGLAVEDLCTQLYERGAVCSAEQLAAIRRLVELFRIDPWYCEILDTSIPFRPWPYGPGHLFLSREDTGRILEERNGMQDTELEEAWRSSMARPAYIYRLSSGEIVYVIPEDGRGRLFGSLAQYEEFFRTVRNK